MYSQNTSKYNVWLSFKIPLLWLLCRLSTRVSKNGQNKELCAEISDWVSAHPLWAHRPAYTKTTHRAQCSEMPRFSVKRIPRNRTTELEGKAIKRKVIRPSPLWWSSFYPQCRASCSAPRANHKAGGFQSCCFSPRTFPVPRQCSLCLQCPQWHTWGKAHPCFYKRE